MKISPTLLSVALIIGLICLMPNKSTSQSADANTAGELTFSVKTVTANGNFAPKHVLAIWIENAEGFVKSRLVRANNRKQYLYTWNAKSGGNDTDATTGATLTSHVTVNTSWDCTDLDGNVLPDGEYTLYVEFTEKHAQGPITSVTFTKGTEEVHLTPADEDNFINMMLDYIPEITTVPDLYESELISVYPNPGNGEYFISTVLTGELHLMVYDVSGKIILDRKEMNASETSIHEIDLTPFKNGIYFVKISSGEKSSITKLLKQ